METQLRNNKWLLLAITFIIFPLILISDSKAAQVTFVVEGHLDYVGAELAGTFSIGDLYHLEYTFDPNTIDSVPGDPGLGGYNNSISSLSVQISSYYAVAASNGRSHITVINDHPVDADQYRVDLLDPMVGNSINGYDLANYQASLLSMTDLSMNVFSNDELITYALAPSNFIGYMALTFENSISGTTGIQADISSFQVSSVPVPNSFWLFLPGLISLFGISRFKK